MFPLSLFTFLLYSTFAVVVFYLPLYLQYKGLSTTEIGLILASGSLTTIFAPPFWGYMSDKKKTIKRVLIFILLSAIVVSIGLFSVYSIFLLLIIMAVFMFFVSSAIPLLDSLLINFAYENHRNYGTLRLWGEIGIGVSAVLLGFITEAAGIQYLGYMYGSLMILAVLSANYVNDAKVKPIPVTRDGLKKLFGNRSFLWFLVLVLLIAAPQRMNEGMLALYLEQLGGTESQVGKAWMLATFSAVPAMALMGTLLRRYHELSLFIIASFFFALRWGINSFAENPAILIYSQLLHFATFPLFFVSSIHFIYKIVPEELRVTGQATLAAVYFGLGGIIGNGGGGWIMDHYGPQILYQTGSFLCLTGGTAALFTYLYIKKVEG